MPQQHSTWFFQHCERILRVKRMQFLNFTIFANVHNFPGRQLMSSWLHSRVWHQHATSATSATTLFVTYSLKAFGIIVFGTNCFKTTRIWRAALKQLNVLRRALPQPRCFEAAARATWEHEASPTSTSPPNPASTTNPSQNCK